VKIRKQIEEHKKKEEEGFEDQRGGAAGAEGTSEKTERYLNLRRLIATAKDSQEQYQLAILKLQKQLDDLMVELEGLKKQQAEGNEEKALLAAEIETEDSTG